MQAMIHLKTKVEIIFIPNNLIECMNQFLYYYDLNLFQYFFLGITNYYCVKIDSL